MSKWVKVKNLHREFGLSIRTLEKMKEQRILPPAQMVDGCMSIRREHILYTIDRVVSDACEAIKAADDAIKAQQEVKAAMENAPDLDALTGNEIEEMTKVEVPE